jgi:hypothetical protein
LGCLLFAFSGWGGAGRPVKVEGVVTLDGQPFVGATVMFTPATAGRGTKPASGRTDANGAFLLTTYRSDDGALPGTYKVVVTRTEQDSSIEGKNPDKMSPEDKMKFFSRPAQNARTGGALTKSKSKGVPAVYTDVKSTPLQEVVPPQGRIEIALKSTAK